MKRSRLALISLAVVLVFLTACSNTKEPSKPLALPKISDKIQNETNQTIKQSDLVKETTISINEKKRNITLTVVSTSKTNQDYAEVIGLNFAKTLAIGAATDKDNNLSKPENDSLGALYSYYDLNVIVKQEDGRPLAKGKKLTSESKITWDTVQ
ncbi:hypothetical protein [Bacillus sp. NPDC077027]|uniref:hypothetical protein n=1 Tax=Bacillus sp. NPDC077027 TaxID=3390548 RepID=UPI003D07D352